MIKTTLPESAQHQRVLQLSLYSGIAMIVISMLFMMRGASTFLGEAVAVLAVPVAFYAIGLLVYRYLEAPLAAPGIVATGAWLVGVGLIHLYDRRILLPEAFQPYYWLIASIFAMLLITYTGHRVRSWMFLPLLPLVQVNALWALMSVLGIDVAWMPVISFSLVMVWWELPLKDARWRLVYQISAIILAALLLTFIVWLPLATPQVLMFTWAAGAVTAAILGWRHGWTKFGPVAIVMLTFATMWGLPVNLWSPVWLGLAAATVVFLEHMAATKAKRGEDSKDAGAVILSKALAIILCGVAALLAQAAPILGIALHPLTTVGIQVSAGILLLWVGLRRDMLAATHAGLWLIFAGWVDFYYFALPGNGAFGLWLSLYPVMALLVERLLPRKEKRKTAYTMLETISYWPIADLAVGASTIALMWTASNIAANAPLISTVTFAIIVGIWIVASLMYRMPVLLHLALWVAPFPYAIALIIVAPDFWTLPLIGIAVQVLGTLYLTIGHSAPRYRPTMLAPFFIVGYVLIGFGFTMALREPALIPVSLTLIVVASIGTSLTVLLDYHPAWTAFMNWLIPPEKHPFAHKHTTQAFLLLSAWLTAIWLHLMLGNASLPLARQGLGMVLFACLWFLIGRLLRRVPDAAAWPVISAGWFMWLIGLLEVFFAPPEALLTIILGLAISGEALRRSRDAFWVPVLIGQVLFTALRIAWLMSLPGYMALLIVAILISMGGMFISIKNRKLGDIAAITGGLVAFCIWAYTPDLPKTILITALPIVALIRYRDWRIVWLLYGCAGLILVLDRVQIDRQLVLISGIAQFTIGAELVRLIRPVKLRTLEMFFATEADWATPFLWMGIACVGGALLMSDLQHYQELIFVLVLLANIAAIYAARLRIANLPYISCALLGGALIEVCFALVSEPFWWIGNDLVLFGALLAAIACAAYWTAIVITDKKLKDTPYEWLTWWVNPLQMTSAFLVSSSAAFLIVIASLYPSVHPLTTIVCALMIAVYTGSVFLRRRQFAWLVITLGTFAYGWLLMLDAGHLSGSAWRTIPLALALFLVAEAIDTPYRMHFQFVGSLTLVFGAYLSINWHNFYPPTLLVAALHLGLLIGYSLIYRRRIPLLHVLVVSTVGLIFVIVKINVWLAPFLGGVLLIGIALFVEIQRERADHWVNTLVSLWSKWQ
jgi:hypothetical protein